MVILVQFLNRFTPVVAGSLQGYYTEAAVSSTNTGTMKGAFIPYPFTLAFNNFNLVKFPTYSDWIYAYFFNRILLPDSSAPSASQNQISAIAVQLCSFDRFHAPKNLHSHACPLH